MKRQRWTKWEVSVPLVVICSTKTGIMGAMGGDMWMRPLLGGKGNTDALVAAMGSEAYRTTSGTNTTDEYAARMCVEY